MRPSACSLAVFALAVSTVVGCGDDDGSKDGAPPDGDTGWVEAFDATETGWLFSVWGPSPDLLFAVGGTPDQGVIMRYDGTGWQPVDTGLAVPLLNWVYGFGPNDVFFVGNGGTAIRYDGTTFTLVDTPTEEDLWGVWGESPSEVWAVGGTGFEGSVATLLKFDGSAFSAEAVPELERPGVRAFFKVWGSSADNVFVVGQKGAVLRYDGAQWTEQLVGASEDLIAVWGTGPDHVLAVGGRGNGIVSRWDGTGWHTEQLAPLPGLNGVWMRNDSTAHIVGVEGTIAILAFDDLSYEADYQPTRLAYHAIFGDVGGRLTAVGGNFASPMGPYHGVASTRPLGETE